MQALNDAPRHLLGALPGNLPQSAHRFFSNRLNIVESTPPLHCNCPRFVLAEMSNYLEEYSLALYYEIRDFYNRDTSYLDQELKDFIAFENEVPDEKPEPADLNILSTPPIPEPSSYSRRCSSPFIIVDSSSPGNTSSDMIPLSLMLKPTVSKDSSGSKLLKEISEKEEADLSDTLLTPKKVKLPEAGLSSKARDKSTDTTPSPVQKKIRRQEDGCVNGTFKKPKEKPVTTVKSHAVSKYSSSDR